MKQWLRCSAIVLVVIGNAPLARSQSGTTAADRAAIKVVEDRLVKGMLGKDWKAVAALYADEAVLMPPNAPAVVGGQAIVAWLSGAGMTISAFTISSESIEVENSLATDRGTYTLTFTVAGMPGPATDRGKYLWALRKGSDGAWRITANMFGANSPPPPLAQK